MTGWTGRRRWLVAAAAVAAAGLIGGGVAGWLLSRDAGSVTPPAQTVAGGEPSGEPSGETPAEAAASGTPCPFDGSVAPAENLGRRPLLVSIDNYPSARPQAGLDRACIVYEVLAEGGITRLLALFQCRDSGLVGPVRSARHYFIDVASESGAALAHVGGSPQFESRIRGSGVVDVDDMRGAGAFWRVNYRRPPHNLYTSTAALWKALEKRGLGAQGGEPPSYFRFESDPVVPPGPLDARRIEIAFPGAISNRVSYSFDETSGGYRRFVEGLPHLDASGAQLRAATVVVQFVPTREIEGDREGRLDMDLAGGGGAVIFARGTAVRATWEKPDRRSATLFRLDSGDPPAAPPGPVWVEIVPVGARVEWKGGDGE